MQLVSHRVRCPWQREWGRGCQTSSPHLELENHSSPCLVTWNGDALSWGNGSGTCCERPAHLSQSWWFRRQETCCENESVSFPIPPLTWSGSETSSDALSGTLTSSETWTWNETGIWNWTDCGSCPEIDSCFCPWNVSATWNEILSGGIDCVPIDVSE